MKRLLVTFTLTLMTAVAWSAGVPDQGQIDENGLENYVVESGTYRIHTGIDMPDGYTDGERVPAVVFVPGSGASVFPEYTDGMMDTFLREPFGGRGYAIIHYNKRGIGASTGNYKWGSIESRAADVRAIIDFYRDDPRIDSDQIGIIGHSQGGWVVTLVGMQDPRVSFVISLAGPTTTVREQDMGYYELAFECEGMSSDEKAAALEKIERKHDRMIRVGGWFPFFSIRLMHNILDYDPADSLRNARQPTLIALAEFDNQAPAIPSMARLEELFPGELPSNVVAHVAPATDHFFHVTDTYCLDYLAALDDPFSPEFLTFYRDWIEYNTHDGRGLGNDEAR